MKTSEDGVRFIAGQEGFIGHIYDDFAGVKTIGYGHALRPGETYKTLSEAEAIELLHLDLRTAEGNVDRLVRVPLTQAQYDALVSFTFNEGGGHLASSTILRLLNAGDYDGAANEFDRWDKYFVDGVMHTSETLKKRRAAEKETFLSAKPPREYSENVQPAAVIDVPRKDPAA